MAYVKQTWKNLPDPTTPLSAARLNHLETQYDEAVQAAKTYTDSRTPDAPGGFELETATLINDLEA